MPVTLDEVEKIGHELALAMEKVYAMNAARHEFLLLENPTDFRGPRLGDLETNFDAVWVFLSHLNNSVPGLHL